MTVIDIVAIVLIVAGAGSGLGYGIYRYIKARKNVKDGYCCK